MKESENMKFARANYGKGVEYNEEWAGNTKYTSDGIFEESDGYIFTNGRMMIYNKTHNKWATIVQPKEEIKQVDVSEAYSKMVKTFQESRKEEVDVETLANNEQIGRASCRERVSDYV